MMKENKVKVYCKNCEHYSYEHSFVLLILGVILAGSGMSNVAKNIIISIELIFGGVMFIVWSYFIGGKHCNLEKKAYLIKDTPEEHTEELVTLTEYDLNSHNDCEYYEVK